MIVPTILEIYTTFAGWIFNNVMTDIIKVGFILIPFVFMIVNNIRNARASGSYRGSAEIALKKIETDFFEMLFIAMFFFVPFYPLQLSALSYEAPPTNFVSKSIPASVTVANDPTTYATTLNPTVNAMNSSFGSAKVPIGFYLIMRLAYGANYALTKELIASNARNDLRAAEYSMSQFALNDSRLNSEVIQFNNDCFIPARSKFIAFSSDGSINSLLTPEGVSTLNDNPDDINQLSSKVFQTTPGLYAQCSDKGLCQRTLQASKPIEGFAYQPSRDGYRPPEQSGYAGQPLCNEWWASLRSRIITANPDAMTVVNKIQSNLGINFGADKEDVVANRIIRNSYRDQQSTSTTTIAGLNPTDIVSGTQNAISSLGMRYSNFFESFKQPVAKNGISILLALVLTIFYINIPLLLLFSGLRASGLLTITGILVTLILAHTVISVVEFMEVSIYNAVYGDRNGFISGLVQLDQSTFLFIMNIAYPLVFVFYIVTMNSIISGLSYFSSSVSAGASVGKPTGGRQVANAANKAVQSKSS